MIDRQRSPSNTRSYDHRQRFGLIVCEDLADDRENSTGIARDTVHILLPRDATRSDELSARSTVRLTQETLLVRQTS